MFFNHNKLFFSILSKSELLAGVKSNKKLQFYQINSRDFMKGFKGFKSFKKSIYENVYKDNKSESKDDEWYTIQETLIFNNKRFELLKLQKNDKITFKILPVILVSSAIFTGYNTFKNLILFRPFRTLLWGCTFLYVLRIYAGTNINKQHFIFSIRLMDDGKNIEIETPVGSSIINIKQVRRLTPEEALYFSQNVRGMNDNYIPIIISNKLYLIMKHATDVFHKDIFAAITRGEYIRMMDDDIINKDKVIDVDSK